MAFNAYKRWKFLDLEFVKITINDEDLQLISISSMCSID
jgi:hypothetical protein